MKYAVISLVLFLAGCQTAIKDPCVRANTLYTAFLVLAEDGLIRERTVVRVTNIYNRIETVCTTVRTARTIAEVSGLLEELKTTIEEGE